MLGESAQRVTRVPPGALTSSCVVVGRWGRGASMVRRMAWMVTGGNLMTLFLGNLAMSSIFGITLLPVGSLLPALLSDVHAPQRSRRQRAERLRATRTFSRPLARVELVATLEGASCTTFWAPESTWAAWAPPCGPSRAASRPWRARRRPQRTCGGARSASGVSLRPLSASCGMPRLAPPQGRPRPAATRAGPEGCVGCASFTTRTLRCRCDTPIGSGGRRGWSGGGWAALATPPPGAQMPLAWAASSAGRRAPP